MFSPLELFFYSFDLISLHKQYSRTNIVVSSVIVVILLFVLKLFCTWIPLTEENTKYPHHYHSEVSDQYSNKRSEHNIQIKAKVVLFVINETISELYLSIL